MGRRKGQLLDILRQQEVETRQAAAGASATGEPVRVERQAPQSPRRAVPWSRGVPMSRALPWMSLFLVGLLAVPLTVWLARRFRAEPVQAATAPRAAAPRTAPAAPKEGEAAGAKENGARAAVPAQDRGAAPAEAAEAPYSILAVTYPYNTESLELGRRTEEQLLRAGFTEISLVPVPDDRNPKFLELYVGQAATPEALEPVRDRLRQLILPTKPDEKPFASAYVRRARRSR